MTFSAQARRADVLRLVLLTSFVLCVPEVAVGVPAGAQIWHEDAGDYPLVLERSGPTLKFSLESGSSGLRFDNPIRFVANVDGNKIVGLMPVYVSKNCAKTSFQVEGTYTPSKIVVRGNEPYLDRNGCASNKNSLREFVFNYVFTSAVNTSEKVPLWDRESPIREAILRDPLGLIPEFARRLPPSGSDVSNNIIGSMIAGIFPQGLGIGDCVISAYDLPDFSSGEDKFIYDYLQRIADNENDKQSFITIGYPPEIIERVMDAYTRASLSSLLRLSRENPGYSYHDAQEAVYPNAEAAVLELELYRRNKNPDLPKVDARGVCGGDYFGVNSMLLDPPDGRLWLISQFNFDFCTSTGVDPLDTKCDLWFEALKGSAFPNGMYRYRARWQDGSTQTSQIELFNSGGEDEQKYVVRKQ
ncbi:hypothetical protein [Mesorhizobium sp. ISC15]|uniref:hypothetical protein n=1 Tax=Mesorhizobium sp. ISC15 TaxID=3076429 RepID=UPI00301BAF12